jgi:hypothetical protein
MTPSGKGERPSGARGARRRRADGQPREEGSPGEEPGVLTSLPSTRPQRPSARRAAARSATAAPVAAPRAAPATAPKAAPATVPAKAKAKRPAKPTTKVRPVRAPKLGAPAGPAPASKPKTSPPRRVGSTAPGPSEPAIPRQGFEAEESIEQGHSVQPPSGTELAASVAELFGELAQAGLSAGGRLLKETVTRLSGS